MRRVPDQRARGLQLGGHLRAHVLDRLKARDHAAELRALLGVLDRLIEHGLAGSERVRREHCAARVEHAVESARCSTGSPEERGRFDGLEPQLRQAARAVDGRERLDLEPRGVRRHQLVVLGLVTTKSGMLESRDELRKRVDEAARYVPLDQLCLSPQCGFSSTVDGNTLSVEQELAKLRLVVETAEEIWG